SALPCTGTSHAPLPRLDYERTPASTDRDFRGRSVEPNEPYCTRVHLAKGLKRCSPQTTLQDECRETASSEPVGHLPSPSRFPGKTKEIPPASNHTNRH